MPTFTSAQVGLSYPKGRDCITKIIPIARTDSSTPKCLIPKDAVICGLHVYQAAAAVTGAATYNLGWSGATTALLNAFSLPTSTVGLANSGSATGTSFLTKLDSDKLVIGTFGGASSAGGTGYIIIEYFMPGGQEQVDD